MEYIVCATVQKIVRLGRFLQSLRVVPHVTDPVVIYCDSMAAFANIKDPKYLENDKHVETHYHYIQNIVAQNMVGFSFNNQSHCSRYKQDETLKFSCLRSSRQEYRLNMS